MASIDRADSLALIPHTQSREVSSSDSLSLDQLPSELILCIFDHLKGEDLRSVALVCRKFNHLTNTATNTTVKKISILAQISLMPKKLELDERLQGISPRQWEREAERRSAPFFSLSSFFGNNLGPNAHLLNDDSQLLVSINGKTRDITLSELEEDADAAKALALGFSQAGLSRLADQVEKSPKYELPNNAPLTPKEKYALAMAKGDTKSAISHLHAVQADFFENPMSPEREGGFHQKMNPFENIDLIIAFAKHGDYKNALSHLGLAHQFDAEEQGSMARLNPDKVSRAYSACGLLPQSRLLLEEGFERNETSMKVEFLLEIAKDHIKQGQESKFVESLRRIEVLLEEKVPNDCGEALYKALPALAEVYLELGNTTEAKRLLERLEDPMDPNIGSEAKRARAALRQTEAQFTAIPLMAITHPQVDIEEKVTSLIVLSAERDSHLCTDTEKHIALAKYYLKARKPTLASKSLSAAIEHSKNGSPSDQISRLLEELNKEVLKSGLRS